jgi:hypothetical protein
LSELDGGRHPEIGFDQHPLHVFQIFGVETPHQRADIRQRDLLDT